MKFDEQDLSERAERRQDEIAETKGWIADGKVPADDVGILDSIARQQKMLAKYHALLGNEPAALDAFAEAADYHIQHIRESRNQRESVQRGYWLDEPAVLASAMNCALLGRDPSLRETATTEAMAMDDAYLTEFEANEESEYRFFGTKLAAALIQDGSKQEQLLTRYETAIQSLDNVVADINAQIYAGIWSGDADQVQTSLEDYLSWHADRIPDEPADPDTYVADTVAARYKIARQQNLAVSIETEFIPGFLLQETNDN